MTSVVLKELVAGTVLAGLSQWLATHLAFWPARKAGQDRHWTEQARRSWSARLLISVGPATLLGIMLARGGRDLHGAEGIFRVTLLPIAVCLGAMIGGLPVARRIHSRRVRFSDVVGEYGISFLVLAPGVSVFLAMMVLLIPQSLGATSIAIMAGGLVIAFALTLGLGIPIARTLGLLSPAPPRLVEVVRTASEQAQIAPPPVDLLHWHAANAVAFPFARILAFTPASLEILTDAELHAICLHEIAHLQESVRTKLTRLSGLLVVFPLFTCPVWFKEFGPPGIIVPLLIYGVGGRLLRGLSQRMEHAADAAARGENQSEQASCYAQALEKLYQYNSVPAVMRGNSQTHPHLYDRLLAAGLTPEYARPQSPSTLLFFVAIICLILGTILPLEILSHPKKKAKTYYRRPSGRIYPPVAP